MEFLYDLILKVKENYYFILIFILLIVINDAIILSDLYSLKNNEVKIIDNTKLNETVKDDAKDLFVDIKGEVKKEGVYKVTSGMTVNDQTTPNMIQRISGIFERKPLISKEI